MNAFNSSKKILITGAAGFIGAATSKELLKRGFTVIGLDDLNNYYDVNLKKSRLNFIENSANKSKWKFFKFGIEDDFQLEKIFNKFRPEIVINLAAQAGVRFSIKEPKKYISSNLVGFSNILEMCRNYDVENFIYASSSSVYGGNRNLPYHEDQSVNHPISLYAATKKSNELMAHSYSHLYGLPSTGLRFFTVYGPWGRPDMAPMIFAKAIMKGDPIEVYNFGDMKRDFTYIDDVVEVICRCCNQPAKKDKNFNYADPLPSISFSSHRIFNVGNENSIGLLNFISILEKVLGKKVEKIFKPIQDGDVVETAANTDLLEKWINFKPKTKLEDGLNKFAFWYLDYFRERY